MSTVTSKLILESLGNKFYIIIEGKVAVLLPRPENVSTLTSPPMSPPINLLSQESNNDLGRIASEKKELEPEVTL